MFLEHTARLASAERKIRPGVKVLLWDDMIWTASVDNLVKPVILTRLARYRTTTILH